MARRVTVQLPEDFLDRARRTAAAERRTLGSLIEDWLQAIVKNERKPAERMRIMPRTSKGAGGLMPEVDLTNPLMLQEHDDVEYVRRIRPSE